MIWKFRVQTWKVSTRKMQKWRSQRVVWSGILFQHLKVSLRKNVECSELSIPEGRSCKVDGRSKPRTQKQIQSYSNNFGKRDSLAKKVEELDSRLRFLQRVVLSLRGK